ncbi:hypothetical protein EDD16DRAFT_1003914 [Pisolithus croceorrhizus]|nr:hypothetical protein EDD16DRAFT_1003914 [Pisolithus croceorrhizus]KAI6144869.1 hypothetical protein EDD17DRAFT_146875 [Pisolithus thermaeus]
MRNAYLRGRRWFGSITRTTMSYSEHFNSPQHHDCVNFKTYSLSGAVGDAYQNKHGMLSPEPTHMNTYANCPSTLCLCLGPNGMTCDQYINCGSAPDHFRNAHGIKDTARGVTISCRWIDCNQQLQRHNFVRHIREFHLRHRRDSGHSAS